MTRTSLIAAVASLALLLPAQRAAAQTACAPTTFEAGPVNPTNGFAEYVRDSNGLALELCLDGDGATGLCFFDPVVPNNLFSQQIGFGPEAFWWLSEAAIDTTATDPVNGDEFSALVVMAAEAAFATENPAPGTQFPFTRLRFRLDVPVPGVYTVTHPYGVDTFTVDALEAGPEIFETFDVQFTPGTGGNQGRVGPWLRHVAPVPPDGFIGNGDVGTVTGSPCNTNFFQVSAVGADGPILIDPADIDGDGSTSSVRTNLFVVFGKIFDEVLGTPLVSDRTSYERDAAGAGQVDVFATSTPIADVTVAGGPNFPAGEQLLGTSGNTKFIRSDVLAPDATVLPSFLSLLGIDPDPDPATNPTRLLTPLVDVVRITRAEYNVRTGLLLVEATSSDAFIPPVLTVVEYDAGVGQGIATVAPPARVTVVSSHGGSDVELVTVVDADAGAQQPPIANDDAASTLEDTAVTVNVLANDTDVNGDTLTVASVADVTNGTAVNNGTSVTFTPAPNFFGTGSFTYVASDGQGGLSGPATVTVTVLAVNDAPVAVDDGATTPEDTPVTIDVVANDTDVEGDALAVTAVTQPASGGTALIIGNQVRFTPAFNFSGVVTFSYTVSDGAATDTGAVTVTVTAVNDAPTAVNDNVSATSGATTTIAVLANDTDPEGSALTVANLTQPAAGTGSVLLNANQTVAYTAPAGFTGPATFTYQAQDAGGALSNVATVTVQVSAVAVDLDIRRFTVTNRVRVSRAQAVSISLRVQNAGTVNQPRTAQVTGVQNNVTVYSVTQPVQDAVGGGDTTFTFTPFTPTVIGNITWTAEIFDDNGDVDRATATTQVTN